MHKHPAITEERLRIALGRTLRPMIHRRTAPVSVSFWDVGGEPVPYEQALAAKYQPMQVGQKWGAAWDTTWFRVHGTIPPDWAGESEAILSMDLGPEPTWCEGISCEGLAWLDGRPVAAVNLYRDDLLRWRDIKGDETFEIHVEAAANIRPENVPDGSWHVPADFGGEKRFTLKRCELRTFDRKAWQLVIAYELLLDLLKQLPAESERRGQLLAGLNHVLNIIGPGDAARIDEARALLTPLLNCKNADHTHRVSAVGHAHIDTAWLWPLRETIRKCARTFTSALNYMDEYPEYVFACSQPQQLAWMKKHYPDVFDRVRLAVQRGQWNPTGSMWIEADCNIPSGESLVRQFLHGQRFYQREFGLHTRDLWLPDVFGYSANLPQIMAGCGVESFMTQKMSWNQFNPFPHHTFLWQGIDGSEVFTHFPPTNTYNGSMRPDELSAGVKRFREHDRASRSLYPFGHGDGGGGPTREMIESARLMQDLQGLPRVQIEPVNAFFDKARHDATDIPTWVGELYLEFHRGTYTSQAWIKRANRQSERLLRDAELFDAIHWLDAGTSATARIVNNYEPPAEAVYETPDADAASTDSAHLLDRAWKLLLLNQFHDIIPGSSIAQVYQDARRDHETIQSLAGAVMDHASSRLFNSAGHNAWCVVNTLGHERKEVIQLPQSQGLVLVSAPACGYQRIDLHNAIEPQHPVRVQRSKETITLSNGLLSLAIDTATGLLTQLTDHRADDREVFAPMPGESAISANILQLHHDRPIKWDAWDIDPYYDQAVEEITSLESIAVHDHTSLRAEVVIHRQFGKSSIRQHIILSAESARIDFRTQVDWHERHRMLKVALPVAVRSDHAAYEVQFGTVERPTHTNTSWDLARFEVCAQRWADLSEGGAAAAGGYGVALMNDCKYGYDIRGNVMRLTLLRSPIEPDPQADQGSHIFTYALYPHPGDRAEARVVQEAMNLNSPLVLLGSPTDYKAPASQSWLSVDRPGVVIESIKVAEHRRGLIVRLYEAHGTRGRVSLRVPATIVRAQRTNLLEVPTIQLPVHERCVMFDIKPYEILTLCLYPETPG